jgi:hypothetical protein
MKGTKLKINKFGGHSTYKRLFQYVNLIVSLTFPFTIPPFRAFVAWIKKKDALSMQYPRLNFNIML